MRENDRLRDGRNQFKRVGYNSTEINREGPMTSVTEAGTGVHQASFHYFEQELTSLNI